MERLQKVLARAGIASRRAAEQIILAGRVRVDGRVVRELGTQVDERKSRVEVDGNKIVAEKLVYIVLHKPRGVVCTLSDPEGRPTIRELIKDAGGRLVPVGRLDFHTSGALLCTNDGEFAQALAHPTREVPKVYVAKVKGTVEDDALERFRERVMIDGRPTQPAQVKRLRFEGDKTWLEITLREGRNRQVRRLGEATGFPVMRLARLSHAGVTSEDLRPGQWRELTVDELVDLKKSYGVPKKVRTPSLDYTKGQPARGEGAPAKFDKRALQKAARDARKPARPDRDSARGSRDARGPAARHDARAPSDAHAPARTDSRSRSARSDARAPARGPAARSDSRISDRKYPSQGKLAHSASQNEPNRRWKTRSRSAIEGGPGKNSARPSADRGTGREYRRTHHAKSGGNRDTSAPVADLRTKVAGGPMRSAEEKRNNRPSADRGSVRKNRGAH